MKKTVEELEEELRELRFHHDEFSRVVQEKKRELVRACFEEDDE